MTDPRDGATGRAGSRAAIWAAVVAAIGGVGPTRPGAQAQERAVVVVALSARDSVALFDARSLERLAGLEVGHNPHEIAASPDGRRAYVANAHDSTISVVDAARVRVVATWRLPDGIRVHDVAASADGRTVWAASGEARTVLDLDAATGVLRRRLPIDRPGGWMVSTDGPGGALVVANLEGGAVTLLDPATGDQRSFNGGEGEIDAATTPDGRQIWSVNYRDGSLTVFDARTGGIVVRRPVSSANASRILFTPDGRTALVVSAADSAVVAFDVATREARGSVTVAAGPKVIALSRDGRRAYVTHPGAGRLTVIDVPTMTVVGSTPVAGVPDGVALLAPTGNGQ